MFYTYADKLGDGFFGGWQLRQIAFDTMRRYLYYSAPTKSEFPIPQADESVAARATSMPASASAVWSEGRGGGLGGVTPLDDSSSNNNGPAGTGSSAVSEQRSVSAVSEVAYAPSRLVWKRKIKVTAVHPLATRAHFVLRSANEKDLYQLEIKGEARSLATGETPSVGPLLCPSAGLSRIERERCNEDNDAYIRDPFFLKELFDGLRDQFDEIAKERVRAAAAAPDPGSGGHSVDDGAPGPANSGMHTLVSPRQQKSQDGNALEAAVSVPVRLLLRCRDEREFRRLWYVLQTVLGYDKLIVRPYRGLPPYDPRNGVAFAHIPMAVWHTFHSLDKAVFYTFLRGNFYALEENQNAKKAAAPTKGPHAAVPKITRVLEGGYLCITHDSVLCMRDTGNVPRWLRLAEVREFQWNVVSLDDSTHRPAPFCVFLSDAPVPDLFFEPLPPAFGADAIASYNPIVDVRRIARVMHDTCFASLTTRRVIRMREAKDASVEAYVTRMVREGHRLPAVQTGVRYNSTLSCPLPKEQLAVVWQQVQSELLERGNMANRAAIPIYPSNARDVELSEDQLSTVERQLDDERERRDDVVGMPLERARQAERRRRAAVHAANTNRSRRGRHRDPNGGSTWPRDTAAPPNPPVATTTTTQVLPLTMELLQTPQLQGRFATHAVHSPSAGAAGGGGAGTANDHDSESVCSSPSASTMHTSEYSSYLVPGARYITQEEWTNGGYGSPASPLSNQPGAAGSAFASADALFPAPAAEANAGAAAPAASSSRRGSDVSGFASDTGNRSVFKSQLRSTDGSPADYEAERTVNEIVGRSMAALDAQGQGPQEPPPPSRPPHLQERQPSPATLPPPPPLPPSLPPRQHKKK